MIQHLVVEVPGDEGGACRDAGDDAPECHAPALVDMELPGLRPAPRHLDPGCDHPELEGPGQLGQGRHLALVQARVRHPQHPYPELPDSGERVEVDLATSSLSLSSSILRGSERVINLPSNSDTPGGGLIQGTSSDFKSELQANQWAQI